MPTYERVVDGEIVERVTTLDNSLEDVRLGSAALEERGGWRAAGRTEPSEPDPDPAPKPKPPTRRR